MDAHRSPIAPDNDTQEGKSKAVLFNGVEYIIQTRAYAVYTMDWCVGYVLRDGELWYDCDRVFPTEDEAIYEIEKEFLDWASDAYTN